MVRKKYRTDYKKELLQLYKEAELWYIFDYHISIIGSATPLGRINRIKKANKRLRQRGRIDTEIERKLNSQLEDMANLLDLNFFKPDLELMKKYSIRLIQQYISLGLIKKRKYEKAVEQVRDIRKEWREMPTEKIAKLAELRRKYYGI